MSAYYGTVEIAKIYYGSDEISKAYRGSTLVWSPPLTTSYDNTGGTGDRTSIITVTSSLTPGSGTLNNFVDGSMTDNSAGSTAYSTTAWTGGYFKFDFGSSKLVDEAKWYQSNTNNHGGTQWQGSNNDSDWTNIGSTFTLGGATVQTHTELNSNTTPYRYYRMLGTSGNISGSPWLREIEFKISE